MLWFVCSLCGLVDIREQALRVPDAAVDPAGLAVECRRRRPGRVLDGVRARQSLQCFSPLQTDPRYIYVVTGERLVRNETKGPAGDLERTLAIDKNNGFEPPAPGPGRCCTCSAARYPKRRT